MWLLERLKSELEFMKQVAHKRKYIRKIKERKIMSDSDYQAGMTAAINAYQASVSYASTGFSYTYTPPATSTPPAETVTVF